MLKDTVRKMVMQTTRDDVMEAIEAGAGKEMKDFVWAMSSVAMKWWQAEGAKNSKEMEEIQRKVGELQSLFVVKRRR